MKNIARGAFKFIKFIIRGSYRLILKFFLWLFKLGKLNAPLAKWPYVEFPNPLIYQARAQFINKKAINFEIPAVFTWLDNKQIKEEPKSPFTFARRVKIRLSDYRYKKNVLIFFFPCTINRRSKEIHELILTLDKYFTEFQKNDTEILVVVQSFVTEIRWALNFPKYKGGLRGLKFPILADPWGLLTTVYCSQNLKQNSFELQGYSSFFINKKGKIQAMNFFDKKQEFKYKKMLKVIELLKD